MKRVFFFLIVIFFSAGVALALEPSKAIVAPVNVLDSNDIFNNITDISKQVRLRVLSSESSDAAELVQPAPIIATKSVPQASSVNDSLKPPAVAPADTVAIKHLHGMLFYLNPLDSIYHRKENGTLQLPLYSYNTESMHGLTFRDTLFYSPLFLPMIFTGQMLPHGLSLYSPDEIKEGKGLLIPQENTFASKLRHLDFVRKVRRDYYVNYPERMRYSILSFDSIPLVTTTDEVVKENYNPFKELIRAETSYTLQAPGVEGATIDRKYWVLSGEHSFQFSQNHFSDNWHKGGTNNLNINSYNALRANFKKNKVRFNNMLEWRLQVFNAPDDTIRSYRIGNDLVRYYGDFGLDAFIKGWSYSMNIEAKSQLFNAYPVNSSVLRSSLLSPLYTNIGVGLKYNLDKRSEKVRHRRIRWDLAISPISISHRYVWSDSVKVTRYGIPEGEKSLLDFGTTVTSNITYDITRYITWRSRLHYFTPYNKVVSDFENTLSLALSNAFSTTIYLHVRFDDSVPLDPKFKYWQISQTLSFGLNYKW